jgi:predicted phosphodiesterase
MKLVLTSDLHYGFDDETHHILGLFFRKVKKDDADGLIIAGDLISSHQNELEPLCQLIRDHLDIPVYVVFGNHDYWEQDYKPRTDLHTWYRESQRDKKEICQNYGIHYLQNNPVFLDDCAIFGFDGWYGQAMPPTNDNYHMPMDPAETNTNSPLTHLFMKARAEEALDKILNHEYSGRKIVVSHFPTNTMDWRDQQYSGPILWNRLLLEKSTTICFGHSHSFQMYSEKSVQILNCGSDYNDPRRVIFNS